MIRYKTIWNGCKYIKVRIPRKETWDLLVRHNPWQPGYGTFQCRRTGEVREFKISKKNLSIAGMKHFGVKL